MPVVFVEMVGDFSSGRLFNYFPFDAFTEPLDGVPLHNNYLCYRCGTGRSLAALPAACERCGYGG